MDILDFYCRKSFLLSVSQQSTQEVHGQLDRPLSPEADIPDHSAFPLYAPSFTLDVPPGHVQDQNTSEYLDDVRMRFDRIAELIIERLGGSV